MKPQRDSIQPTATQWVRIMDLYHRRGYSLAGAVKKMREEEAAAAENTPANPAEPAENTPDGE